MILEVALNLASQILFFIVVVYLIPWLGYNFVDKNGDFEKIWKKYEECEDEEEMNRLAKQMKMYHHFFNIIRVIQSWTSHLWANLVGYIVMLVTFNHLQLETRIESEMPNLMLLQVSYFTPFLSCFRFLVKKPFFFSLFEQVKIIVSQFVI